MAKGDSMASPEAEKLARISEITKELQNFGEQHGLRGLEGRINRGLDPAGMLAVGETRKLVEEIAEALGSSMEDLEKLTKELHVGAIWNNADDLAAAERPDVQVWIDLAQATLGGKEVEGEVNGDEFLEDLERIKAVLKEAIEDPVAFTKNSIETNINNAEGDFELEDGVPVSKLDRAFLSAAIAGHKSAVVEDANGLYFVGANELDYGYLESEGLTPVEKEDRGRMATFYQNEAGEDVVKKLYPGFAIVVNGDREIAKSLARTGGEMAEQAKE
jgi:hypothetical protein